jgi:MATE family multidrug resistance protein
LTFILHFIYFIPVAAIILGLKYPIAITINPNDREATSSDSQMYLYFLLPSSLFAILYEAVKSFMIAHKVQHHCILGVFSVHVHLAVYNRITYIVV